MVNAGFRMLAPAKVNLHLHMTGRASDGYHFLDSLVAFADIGDSLTFLPADTFRLSVDGEASASLVDCSSADNLVSRAAALFADHYHCPVTTHISLEKCIPAGGGLGGGSADAAATLIALPRCCGIDTEMDVLEQIAARLGSDIVACLHALQNKTPVIMRETGNRLYPAPRLPALPALLIKPPSGCPTPQVYKTYAASGAVFSPEVSFPAHFATAESLCDFLSAETRNDLTSAAITVNPDVTRVLDCLAALDGTLLARLSGSGSCCFALMKDKDCADRHAQDLAIKNPDWWVRATFLR